MIIDFRTIKTELPITTIIADHPIVRVTSYKLLHGYLGRLRPQVAVQYPRVQLLKQAGKAVFFESSSEIWCSGK